MEARLGERRLLLRRPVRAACGSAAEGEASAAEVDREPAAETGEGIVGGLGAAALCGDDDEDRIAVLFGRERDQGPVSVLHRIDRMRHDHRVSRLRGLRQSCHIRVDPFDPALRSQRAIEGFRGVHLRRIVGSGFVCQQHDLQAALLFKSEVLDQRLVQLQDHPVARRDRAAVPVHLEELGELILDLLPLLHEGPEAACAFFPVIGIKRRVDMDAVARLEEEPGDGSVGRGELQNRPVVEGDLREAAEAVHELTDIAARLGIDRGDGARHVAVDRLIPARVLLLSGQLLRDLRQRVGQIGGGLVDADAVHIRHRVALLHQIPVGDRVAGEDYALGYGQLQRVCGLQRARAGDGAADVGALNRRRDDACPVVSVGVHLIHREGQRRESRGRQQHQRKKDPFFHGSFSFFHLNLRNAGHRWASSGPPCWPDTARRSRRSERRSPRPPQRPSR